MNDLMKCYVCACRTDTSGIVFTNTCGGAYIHICASLCVVICVTYLLTFLSEADS